MDIAVIDDHPLVRAIDMARTNLLIADDVGLGKTIQAGMFLRQAWLSGRAKRILILVDDLGATDLGCEGSTFYETPNIDRLAGQGMRFRQAYAACTVCSPTRASLLTGKYPARLHVTDWIPGHVDASAPMSTAMARPGATPRTPTAPHSLTRHLPRPGRL